MPALICAWREGSGPDRPAGPGPSRRAGPARARRRRARARPRSRCRPARWPRGTTARRPACRRGAGSARGSRSWAWAQSDLGGPSRRRACPQPPTRPPRPSADTIAIGVFEGEGVAHDLDGGAAAGARRLRRGPKRLPQARRDARRRQALAARRARRARPFDAERARRGATVALGRARELGTRCCAGSCPTTSATRSLARSSRAPCSPRTGSTPTSRDEGDDEDGGLQELIVSAHHDVAAPVEPRGWWPRRPTPRATSRTRRPTTSPRRRSPSARARGGRDGRGPRPRRDPRRRMGAFAAVAQGSTSSPR